MYVAFVCCVQVYFALMCEVITKKIDSTICINGITTPITLYLMSLPRQYDMLLGMDWLQSNDVWLNPRRKVLSLVNGDGTRDAKICLCTASHLSTLPSKHEISMGVTTETLFSIGPDIEVELVQSKHV